MIHHVTMPAKLVGQEFKQYANTSSPKIITENENKKVTNDSFEQSNVYTGKDCFGRKLDLTSIIGAKNGYLQGKLSDKWDVDYYEFSVKEYKMLMGASDKYNVDITITLDHIPEGCEYEMILYDENGNQVGIGTDNGEGGISIIIPNWNLDNTGYTVKIQAKDGSPVNSEEYYHLSFQTKQAGKESSAYGQIKRMQQYSGAVRKKLYEGQDASAEIQELQKIKEAYAAYYEEQLEKLHNEQAKAYLQDGEVPDKEQIGKLLEKMAAGETLTEQENILVQIFATAQEIDHAKAEAQLHTALQEEIFTELEKDCRRIWKSF